MSGASECEANALDPLAGIQRDGGEACGVFLTPNDTAGFAICYVLTS